MRERKRNIALKLIVTQEEKELILMKMGQVGTSNFGAYARGILINGEIIKNDYSQLIKLTGELDKIGSKVNQIAKRANESRLVHQEDVKEVLRMLHQIQILINDQVGLLIR